MSSVLLRRLYYYVNSRANWLQCRFLKLPCLTRDRRSPPDAVRLERQSRRNRGLFVFSEIKERFEKRAESSRRVTRAASVAPGDSIRNSETGNCGGGPFSPLRQTRWRRRSLISRMHVFSQLHDWICRRASRVDITAWSRRTKLWSRSRRRSAPWERKFAPSASRTSITARRRSRSSWRRRGWPSCGRSGSWIAKNAVTTSSTSPRSAATERNRKSTFLHFTRWGTVPPFPALYSRQSREFLFCYKP